MATSVVDERRIVELNDHPPGTDGPVLYWMQAAVRTRHNEALEFAVRKANELATSLLVCFGVDTEYPDSTPRTMRFLVEGVVAVASGLSRRSIPFTVRAGKPLDVALELAAGASAVVMDRAHLRETRAWRRELASRVDVAAYEVETNLVVPVGIASDKREFAARTIRPKLHQLLDDFVVELSTTALTDTTTAVDGLSHTSTDELLGELGIDAPPGRFVGGQDQARAALDRFVSDALDEYRQGDLDISPSASSLLSPYLHYGHLSPILAIRTVRDAGAPAPATEDFIEELLVRRELAHNFVWYTDDYDSYRALPDWALGTLEDHRSDVREEVYSISELEQARTHDRAWNAAMTELRDTGYLHNHLRMYWGKQILTWTNTPEYAHRVILELNNRYLYDGRDANSYANVGWVFGLHDRAFGERDVFGKVRPMTQSGLRRKIDIDEYVRSVEELTGQEIE